MQALVVPPRTGWARNANTVPDAFPGEQDARRFLSPDTGAGGQIALSTPRLIYSAVSRDAGGHPFAGFAPTRLGCTARLDALGVHPPGPISTGALTHIARISFSFVTPVARFFLGVCGVAAMSFDARPHPFPGLAAAGLWLAPLFEAVRVEVARTFATGRIARLALTALALCCTAALILRRSATLCETRLHGLAGEGATHLGIPATVHARRKHLPCPCATGVFAYGRLSLTGIVFTCLVFTGLGLSLSAMTLDAFRRPCPCLSTTVFDLSTGFDALGVRVSRPLVTAPTACFILGFGGLSAMAIDTFRGPRSCPTATVFGVSTGL